jgi:hypothetical protein
MSVVAIPNVINWRRAHVWTSIYLTACLAISITPTPEVGWLNPDLIRSVIIGVFANLGRLVLAVYRECINKFEPQTKLEAKIANEQIKIIANFANSCAIAFFAVVVLGSYFGDRPHAQFLVIVGAIVIFVMNGSARGILAQLKDEDMFVDRTK